MARACTTLDTFNAVAEPKRRRVLETLAQGELPVNDIGFLLGWPQPVVSKHLGVLKEVGLVSVRKNGRQRLYRLQGEQLKPIHDWVKTFERSWAGRRDSTASTSICTNCKRRRRRKMTERKNSSERAPQNELVITRIFDAPRSLVWKAWTDPEHFKKWWGPKNFTAPVIKIDLRVGGKYLWSMRSPDYQQGQVLWSTGVYREIVPPERIVYTDSFADEEGNVVPASHYGMPGDWPSETLVTVTLEEQKGKTKMALCHVGIPAGKMSELTGAGWNQSFDKLAESLK